MTIADYLEDSGHVVYQAEDGRVVLALHGDRRRLLRERIHLQHQDDQALALWPQTNHRGVQARVV